MDLDATQTAFAAAVVDANAPLPAGLTTWRGVADPMRFAIYRNNVAVGLIKALEARFPVTRRLVGDDFFRVMARGYIGVSKPASPLITHYGDDFADFVASFEAADPVPYLADMCRLEAAWTRAYNATDVAALAVADVAMLSPEALLSARLVPHPAASMFHSAFPVGSIWAAHQVEMVVAPSHRTAETVLIARPATEVSLHIIPATDVPFALALLAGEKVAAAAQAALSSQPDFDFGAAFAGLISLGAFRALQAKEVFDDHDD